MSKVCDVCGKKPSFGHNVSHSQRKTPRRWDPNVQNIKVVEGKTVKRKMVCTKCLKAGKVQKA